MKVQNYISLIKQKLNYDYKNNIKNTLSSFLRHLDNEGNIILSEDIIKEFFEIVKLIDNDIENILSDFLNTKINSKIFVTDFFENYISYFSNLLLNDIKYEKDSSKYI